MNIKLRAAIYTVGVLASIFSGAFAVIGLAHFFGTDASLFFAGLLLIFLVYTMYEIMLSKLKMDESIKESMNDIQDRLKKY